MKVTILLDADDILEIQMVASNRGNPPSGPRVFPSTVLDRDFPDRRYGKTLIGWSANPRRASDGGGGAGLLGVTKVAHPASQPGYGNATKRL